jgi:hypothetical protein
MSIGCRFETRLLSSDVEDKGDSVVNSATMLDVARPFVY